jgi:hypothetical protein
MIDRMRGENEELQRNLQANERALSQLKEDYEHTYRIIEQLREEAQNKANPTEGAGSLEQHQEIEQLKTEKAELIKKLKERESNRASSEGVEIEGSDRGEALRELRAENEGLVHQLYDIDQERLRLREELQAESGKVKALELQLQGQPSLGNTGSNKEFERLKSENLELKKQLINRSTASSSEGRGPGSSGKLLEEQVGILTAENGRLKEDRMRAMIDLERFKKMDESLKMVREENYILKEKNHGLEADIGKLWKEEEAIKQHSSNLIENLREENRQLKEAASKRGPQHEEENRHSSEGLRAEKADLEQRLAAGERERDGLKRLVEEQKRQMAAVSKQAPQAGSVQTSEEYQKVLKERYLLQQKVALLEEREKDLLENEANKEQMIGSLKLEIGRLEQEGVQAGQR